MLPASSSRWTRLSITEGVHLERERDAVIAAFDSLSRHRIADGLAQEFLLAVAGQGDSNLDIPSQIRGYFEAKFLRLGIVELNIVDESGCRVARMRSRDSSARLIYGARPQQSVLGDHAYVRRHRDGGYEICTINGFIAQLSGSAFRELIAVLNQEVQTADDWRGALLDTLWTAGILVSPGDSKLPERWSFVDALFHATSRGRFDHIARGATYPYGDAPAQADAAPSIGPKRALDPSETQSLQGITLLDTLNARRSSRGPHPAIDRDLLLRLLRICTADVATRDGRDLLYRAKAYPSAGGLHEIELYVATRNVLGLEDGLFRFDDSVDGDLHRMSESHEMVDVLLNDASRSWGKDQGIPNALLILRSDVPLVSFKYESIAYRLCLLNAGFVMQVICQVAAALRIAVCPLGSGNSAAFAAAAGDVEWRGPSLAEVAIAGRL
jgi:SagB-type dehydrogenase family enzyme